MFISVQIGNDQGGGQHSTTKKTVLNPTPSLEEGGGWGIRQCIHSLTHTDHINMIPLLWSFVGISPFPGTLFCKVFIEIQQQKKQWRLSFNKQKITLRISKTLEDGGGEVLLPSMVAGRSSAQEQLHVGPWENEVIKIGYNFPHFCEEISFLSLNELARRRGHTNLKPLTSQSEAP